MCVYTCTRVRQTCPMCTYMNTQTIAEFMDVEVKKRGADRLAEDVSYKEAKHLTKYCGESIFSGLATALNQVGEIRVQHHVVTDGHDQLEPPLTAMVQTMEANGMEPTRLVGTDKPSEDKDFYLRVLPGVRAQQKKLDALADGVVSDDDSQCMPYFKFDDRSTQVLVASSEGAINTQTLAVRQILEAGPSAHQTFSLDGNVHPCRTHTS